MEIQKNSLGSVCILYVKDISGKFKRVGNRYIRAAFKTKHNRRSCFWELDRKYIRNRQHSVSTTFAVNVTEAELVKQADR
jgi:hypothetical protein